MKLMDNQQQNEHSDDPNAELSAAGPAPLNQQVAIEVMVHHQTTCVPMTKTSTITNEELSDEKKCIWGLNKRNHPWRIIPPDKKEVID